MTPYNDALYQLQKQSDRAVQLRTLMPELRQRHAQLSAHVKEQDKAHAKLDKLVLKAQ